MKNKALTISFLIIVFALAAANALNSLNCLKPAVKKYALHREIEGLDTINDVIADIESSYTDKFVSKFAFVEVNGFAKACMGNWESNERIKLEGGYLVQESYPMELREKAASITELSAWLSGRNTPFVYIAFPNKVEPGKDELRPGRVTSSNKNVDALLAGLEEGGVKYYDIREDYAAYCAAGEANGAADSTESGADGAADSTESGADGAADSTESGADGAAERKSWQAGFFRTDHHWLPETAFWAYTDIAKRLSADYGLKTDEQSLDINNYSRKTYKNQFLGSSGRRTGVAFSGLDDFTILLPEFDTHFTLDSSDEDVHLEGSFGEVMFQKKYLEKDYYNIDTYSVYNGDYDLCVEKNAAAANDMKVLVVKDSYTLALQPYYAFMFSEVDLIDLRYIDNETLKQYIERTRPDMVIMEYSPGTMSEDSLFEYGL